jgi:iron complex transport system substrate-binding protein
MAGCFATVAFYGVGTGSTMYQSDGVVIDFGDYKTYWTDINYDEVKLPLEELAAASTEHKFTYTFDSNGKLYSITTVDLNNDPVTYTNGDTGTWGLWVIKNGSTEYYRSSTYDINPANYKIVSWAFVADGMKPTVALDATGSSIYGYAKPSHMVTLSPVATEIVGAMRAASIIVGTDMYSDYPHSIVDGKEEKTIQNIGTYTDPSYESIMKLSPDMVVCDGSQLSHVKMANSLRNSNINAVVLYSGETIDTILDNIYIVACAMRYEQRGETVDNEINSAISTISSLLSARASSSNTVLVTLGSNASPYVAASGTYINDIVSKMGWKNVASDLDGWPQAISEYLSKWNPSVIIVLDDGKYTSEQYSLFLSTLSEEWKSTDAYKNGDIYLLCEDLGTMSQRSGPRVAQLAEVIARIMDPSAFSDTSTMPKAIGDDYQNYLTYTKNMGYDI